MNPNGVPAGPNVGFRRIPRRHFPEEPKIPRLVPDLAVEVLSESNTKAEMQKKRATYFRAGVRLVWYVDPETESAQAFRSETDVDELSVKDALDGGDVLPGLTIPLRELFARAKQQGPRKS